MKGTTLNISTKIKNYVIALVLLIIGVLPFIYLLFLFDNCNFNFATFIY